MNQEKLNLEKTWKDALRGEFQRAEIERLCSFLEREYAAGEKQIYPVQSEIFAAFDRTPFDRVRVVLIGQDPYHRRGQAHGLCFSFRGDGPLPRSLQNIFREVSRELNSELRKSGDLTGWADQGVLLLNMALTVEEGKPGSHQAEWKWFTNAIIKTLAAKKKNLVFLAWGKEAQKAVERVDREKHKVLESAHPSPFSCRRGFFGNGHFRSANEYLVDTNQSPVAW